MYLALCRKWVGWCLNILLVTFPCRELLFPLPALSARQAILDIHTRQWAEPPPPELKAELANMCVGYCGADMKVRALRQRQRGNVTKVARAQPALASVHPYSFP